MLSFLTRVVQLLLWLKNRLKKSKISAFPKLAERWKLNPQNLDAKIF
ncbi:MAG: hypothetical protein RL757_39 [Bacteroidota bacterium]|jgi:hypothetical protein